MSEIYLVRHGETEWSRDGRHTGRTDVPLTARGEAEARSMVPRLAGLEFDLVLTSPLCRARETCRLAGFGDRAQQDEALREWDYGDFEGLTSDEIRSRQSGWDVFRHGCPGGEAVPDAAARADDVVERLAAVEGRVLVFGHGHFSRAVAVRWIGLGLGWGRHLKLDTASLSVLGHEGSLGQPAIVLWNDDSHTVTLG